MKKLIHFLIIVAMSIAHINAQKIIVNRVLETEKDGKVLLGEQTLSQFHHAPFSTWYTPEYTDYSTKKATVEELKKHQLSSYQITVVLGTWCSDSQREFPRLMKILDEIKYPKSKLHIVALNRKKEGFNGEEIKYTIKRVPTIILYKGRKEIGRIIESPQTGFLEEDLLQIISDKK